MDWFELSGKYHQRTFKDEGRLDSLPDEWQRELAALWRLEADVNNGAYLQFLANWGRESYVYARRALRNIGANKMAAIVDSCQALIDEHINYRDMSYAQLQEKLPEAVIERILGLSYDFMAYPEDIERLGLAHYGRYLAE